jgi:hypothetical protein
MNRSNSHVAENIGYPHAASAGEGILLTWAEKDKNSVSRARAGLLKTAEGLEKEFAARTAIGRRPAGEALSKQPEPLGSMQAAFVPSTRSALPGSGAPSTKSTKRLLLPSRIAH